MLSTEPHPQGRLGIIKGDKPEHQSITNMLKDVCTQTITDIEEQLRIQKKVDTITKQEHEDAEHVRIEQACLDTEQEEQAHQDKIQKLEECWKAVAATKHKLAL
ncbi:hypothetical protein BJV78DRAFT_1287328 [Lactifluus subvellereus]|nr:hypothetical protein BJV78DRAFT_1287328 [Lactifluus subvellereus]